MFLTRSEYDRGVNTFSPEGRLFQVEYAIEAIKLGSTAVGIRTNEGVCLAVEKRVQSTLMVPESMKKILKVDDHIAAAYSGLIADSQTLVNKARAEAKNFWFVYGKPMKTSAVVQTVSNLALEFGDDDAKASMSRPFGVALLFAGWDEKGPALYHLDPSGTFIGCLAKAIGAASEGAEQSLKDAYHEAITLKEAEKLALSILKQVMEDRISPSNVEVAEVVPTEEAGKPGHIRLLSEADLRTLLDSL